MLIGIRATVGAADGLWFVGKPVMAVTVYVLRKLQVFFLDTHVTPAHRRARRRLGLGGDIAALGPPREQVIRIVEADKAFRVLRFAVNFFGLLDADRIIERRVHDQQRLAQGERFTGAMSLEIVNELLPDEELAPGQGNLCLAIAADCLQIGGNKIISNMISSVRRATSHNGANLGHLFGNRKYRCPAKAVTDEELLLKVTFWRMRSSPDLQKNI